jgi:hypothetical protein
MRERVKLTKAQARMLQSVADGEVQMRFDVYAGYWWTERGKRLPSYGKSEHFPPLPIRYLMQGGLIKRSEVVRKLSGQHVYAYYVTDAGRRALSGADSNA